MNKVHLYNSQEKIKWWGNGEWVEEPDLIKFEHHGIQCIVKRMALEEPCSTCLDMFGGYLNGYVSIPTDHPFYNKKYEDLDIDCHGGLTYGESNDLHFIGFDCAHSFDYIPSTEYLKITSECMQRVKDFEEDMKEMYPNFLIFNKTYRNIQFCIDQCIHIAEQLISKSNI